MLTSLFVEIDDFHQQYQDHIHELTQKGLIEPEQTNTPKRNRAFIMTASEVMTIIVFFHIKGFRSFKHYYLYYVCQHLDTEFPNRVSYNRFVELMSGSCYALTAFLHTRFGNCTGIQFIDSTPLRVCNNRRIQQHKVFKAVAARGKCSLGYFYGFKLHLVINERGELLSFSISKGNLDDRKPVDWLTQRLSGRLFADRGYIDQALSHRLYNRGLTLITKQKKNMKPRLMLLADRILLRKRALIESVNDQLKNISQIEHTRHRCLNNFVVNVVSGLIAYTFQDKLPSINMTKHDIQALANI